jgi:hypothetical protein
LAKLKNLFSNKSRTNMKHADQKAGGTVLRSYSCCKNTGDAENDVMPSAWQNGYRPLTSLQLTHRWPCIYWRDKIWRWKLTGKTLGSDTFGAEFYQRKQSCRW